MSMKDNVKAWPMDLLMEIDEHEFDMALDEHQARTFEPDYVSEYRHPRVWAAVQEATTERRGEWVYLRSRERWGGHFVYGHGEGFVGNCHEDNAWIEGRYDRMAADYYDKVERAKQEVKDAVEHVREKNDEVVHAQAKVRSARRRLTIALRDLDAVAPKGDEELLRSFAFARRRY